MILEVACFNFEDALLAQANGADRIEFCEDYSSGGVTPSGKDIIELRREIKIPLYVMIRPRAGNFIYMVEELAEMKRQIEFCRQWEYDGVVFGVLNERNEVETEACKALVELAKPMKCTFHRAFDATNDLSRSLEEIIACGFERILCSGGKGHASDNLDAVKGLIQAAGKRITIMPGGGVRAGNARQIIEGTNCKEIHTAALNSLSGKLDVEELKKIKAALKQ